MFFYKCIFNINLLDVIKRNKQKAWCMNTFFLATVAIICNKHVICPVDSMPFVLDALNSKYCNKQVVRERQMSRVTVNVDTISLRSAKRIQIIKYNN
jgi:hypothetical protein